MTIKKSILSKAFVTIFIIAFLFQAMQSPIYGDPPPDFTILGEAAVLMDANSGRILYEKNMDKPLFPASTTKIMTALLVLESMDLEQRVVTPGDQGPAVGSSMFLLPGEIFTVKELLEGMLIKSGNDASELLAKAVSENAASFVEKMNEKASSLGCTNTHFINPSGLHDPNHISTAHDLAIIAREAMKNPSFREIVNTAFVTLPETPQTPEKRIYRNTNRFLWDKQNLVNYKGSKVPIYYEYVHGIKTGSTPEAGSCLVSEGEYNGIKVISVVLNAPLFQDYIDSRTLLDYGFYRFMPTTFLEQGQHIGELLIKNTVQKKLDYEVKDEFVTLMPVNFSGNYDTEVALKDNLPLPIESGEEVGTCTLSVDGEKLVSLPLYASHPVESIFTWKFFRSIFASYWWIVLLALIAFFAIILLIFSFIAQRKRRHKRKNRRYNL